MSHIVFASYEIAPTTPGGVGVFVSAVAEALLRDGHRVTILLDVGETEFDLWIKKDSKLIFGHACIRSWRVEDHCQDIGSDRDAFPSEAHWRSFRFAHALARMHAEIPLDFVEFFDYCGAAYYTLVARAAEPHRYPSRIAVRLHNTIEIIDRRVGAAFERFRVHDYALERAALALADIVLTPGQRYWDDEASSLYAKVDATRVQCSFPVRRPLERVPGAGEGRDIIFIGRLSTFKGLDRFLHAAVALLGDQTLDALVRRFVVIGPGETVSSSQTESDILTIADGVPPDRLLMLGRLPESEIRRYFADAAVAVFPNRMESFCYAAHEAHMAGVPLILSDTPAFRDHFTDGVSALFFDGTVGGLVDKIRISFLDVALRRRLSDSVETNRSRYARHDYARHLAGVSFVPAPEKNARIGVVVVSSGSDASETRATVTELSTALPASIVWQIEPTESGGIRAFGTRWEVLDRSGRKVCAASQMLPPSVAFVAAGTGGAVTFLKTAATMLSNESRLGAVFPAQADADGLRQVSAGPFALEKIAETGSAVLGAVMRFAGRATLADLFEDGSDLTEITALLRCRERGGILVDHPLLGPHTGRRRHLAGSAMRTRILRQFAWSHDRVLIADELAERTALANRVQQVEASEPYGNDEPTNRSNSMSLYVPQFGSAGGAANKVTIAALRHVPGGRLVEQDELRTTGRWRRVRVADRPQGLLVGEGGRLAVLGSGDPELTLLLGPDQGTAVVSRGGRSVRLNLRDANYWQVTIRVSDLFALCWAAEGNGTPFPGQLLAHGGLADELSASVRQGGNVLTVFEAREDRVLTEATGALAGQTGWVLPEVIRREPAALGLVAAGVVVKRGLQCVKVYGGAAVLPMIEALLRCAPLTDVDYSLRPVLSWQAGGWEWLRATATLASRYPDRLRLHSALGVIQETLRLLGASVMKIPLPIPRPTVHPPPGRVALILPEHSPGVPSCGHIAVAAAMLCGDDGFSCVYVSRSETQAVRILERFGCGHRVSVYNEAEALITTLAGSRFLYCSPFADSAIDPSVMRAFALGGLALVTSGPLQFNDRELRRVLEIAHWEDSMHISAHLRQAIERYDELHNRLMSAAADAVPA